MLIALAFAHAADTAPLPTVAPAPAASLGYAGTVLFPDARHRAPGELEVTAGGFAGLVEVTNLCLAPGGCNSTSLEPIGAPGLRLAWTPGADVRLETNLGYSTDGEVIGTGAVSASGAVSKVVRLGGYLGVAGHAWSDFSGMDGLFGGGFTLAATWPKVALDVSVPLFVVNDPGEETPIFLPWLFTEAHVAFAMGHGHSLRVGTFSAAPGVGWQYEGPHLIARADLHSMGVVTGMRAEVGARF